VSEPVDIVQVLLLFDAQTSSELGLALWAALVEAERFYNLEKPRAKFQRYYISPNTPPIPGLLGSALRGVGKFFSGNRMAEYAASHLSQDESLQSSESSFKAAGRYKNTYDQTKLGQAVGELLSGKVEYKQLLIVTDREITPPNDWRYVIWDSINGGVVISIAPLDPKYWRNRDPNRIATVKYRARAAVLSCIGSMLGLDRCDNPDCFLFRDVDSVSTLDLMSELGPEHHIDELKGRGFQPIVNDPSIIQNVEKV